MKDATLKIGYIPSKEQFVSIIETLREQEDTAREIDAIIKSKACFSDTADFFSADSLISSNVSTVVELLDGAFGDDDLVSYFCFELDFGRDWKRGCYVEGDGTSIDISTPAKVYDYLVSRLEKESE